MICPLCSYEFDETQMSCHTSCTFNKGCTIICCPNCGYQTADESRSMLVQTFRKLFTRKTQVIQGVCPLSGLQPGQTAKVVAIESHDHARVEKLYVIGIVPDAEVQLRQKHPAIIVRVGFTELSLEREVAEDILVRV